MTRRKLPLAPPSPVRVRAPSNNRKLSRQHVEFLPTGRPRYVADLKAGRFVCATTVAIGPTCGPCVFKGRGCSAQAGPHQQALEHGAVGWDPTDIIREECRLVRQDLPRAIRRLGGLWDLRWHEGGDTPNVESANTIAATTEWALSLDAVVASWIYTHRWREWRAQEFGSAVAFASIEISESIDDDIADARARGYRPAIVLPAFPHGSRALEIAGTKFFPCPAETGTAVCTECGYCLDERRRTGVAFAAHGRDRNQTRAVLELKRLGLLPPGWEPGDGGGS